MFIETHRTELRDVEVFKDQIIKISVVQGDSEFELDSFTVDKNTKMTRISGGDFKNEFGMKTGLLFVLGEV